MGRRPLWALVLLASACVRCELDAAAQLNDEGVRLRAGGDLAGALAAFEAVISSQGQTPAATRHAAHVNALSLLSAAHFGVWTANDVLAACRPLAAGSPAIAGMLAHVAREHAIWSVDADGNRRLFEQAVQASVDGGHSLPAAMDGLRPVLGHLTLPFDGIGPQFAATVGGCLDRNTSIVRIGHAVAPADAAKSTHAMRSRDRSPSSSPSGLHVAWVSSDFKTASVGYSLLEFFSGDATAARPTDTCVFTAAATSQQTATAMSPLSWQPLDAAPAAERRRRAATRSECEWQLLRAHCSHRSLGPDHSVHDRLACTCGAFLEYRRPPLACSTAGVGAAVSDQQLLRDLHQISSMTPGLTPDASTPSTHAWPSPSFHVAVDLNGKTLGQRPLLWQHIGQPRSPSSPPSRLAPLVVLYLGFAETMGRVSHDYVLLDHVTQPPETAVRVATADDGRANAALCALADLSQGAGPSSRGSGRHGCLLRKYSERLLYVPPSYHALALPPAACKPPPSDDAGAAGRPFDGLVGEECSVATPDGRHQKRAVVIGFLHAASKLNARALAAAINVVLRSGPCAVLVLLQPRRGADVALLVLREAAARGLPPHRIQLVGAGAAATDNRADTRSVLPLLDVFLDTLPYGAHSSAADALAYGVPVVTIAGEEWAGRVAAGFLHVLADDGSSSTTDGVRAAVLQALVTHSWTEFESVAVALARSPIARAAATALLRASACDGQRQQQPSIWQPASPLRQHVDAGLAAAYEARSLRVHGHHHQHQQEDGAGRGAWHHVVVPSTPSTLRDVR